MRWTITRKIGGLTSILILFIIIILIYSIFVLDEIESELIELTKYDAPLSKIVTEIEI